MSNQNLKFDWVIIDSDPIIYRCGFSIEKRNKDTDMIEVEPVHHAYYNINSMFKKIMKLSKDGLYKAYLTGDGDKTNFRFSIFPQYKENRKDARRPTYYKELREFLITKYQAEVITGEEADDRCSIEHCKLNNLGFDKEVYNSVVCSFDKDFNNVPGWHYNYVTDNLYYVDEIQALRNFYLQILTGDTSDGIPRIQKGWKKKKTELLLQDTTNEDEMYKIVLNEMSTVLSELDESVNLKDVSEWLESRARLVWLRREENEMWSYNR